MTRLLSRLTSRLPSGLPARLPGAVRSPRALAVAAAALVALSGLALVLLATARATVWAPESVTTARISGQPGAPVVVTTPAATALDGPSLRIDVRGPGDRPVFVGVGRADDVAAYLGAVARVEVTGARDGQAVQTRQGAEASLPEPTAADVWTESATGRGSASLTWIQVPGRWRVLAAVDGATAPTEVVLTWERARASSSAPALFAVGGLLLALGVVGAWAARRALSPSGGPGRAPAPVGAVADRAASPGRAPAATGAPARAAPAPGSRRSARLAATGDLPRVPPAAPGRAVDPPEDDDVEEPVAPAPFRQPPRSTS